MRKLLFGNSNTDFIEFDFDEYSVDESVIVVSASMSVGFFQANLTLFIQPSNLMRFLKDSNQLQKTSSGSATLTAEGPENVIAIGVEVLRLGHVLCKGTASVNGNCLSFQFKTDQTQLVDLNNWFADVLASYRARTNA